MALQLHTLSQKDLLLKARQFIPPLLEHFHKGQMGRVAVVGGCEDYTGAPYFSAHASALLGCDMSHVICEYTAGNTIKSYSPNIMVHPYMRSLSSFSPSSPPSTTSTQSIIETETQNSLSRILPLLSRLHVLIIGPGLGRDPIMQKTVAGLIASAREKKISLVLDADALLVVANDPSLIRGNRDVILTPNHVEFRRLCGALGVSTTTTTTTTSSSSSSSSSSSGKKEGEEKDEGTLCAALARELDGVTILQKGKYDWISNGTTTITCSIRGGLKRSGGQGDTLTGCIGTFLAWKKAYLDGLWDHDNSLFSTDLTLLAAYGASAITKLCSRRAFEKKGRSMQASDLSEEVSVAFHDLFEEDEEKRLEAKL